MAVIYLYMGYNGYNSRFSGDVRPSDTHVMRLVDTTHPR